MNSIPLPSVSLCTSRTTLSLPALIPHSSLLQVFTTLSTHHLVRKLVSHSRKHPPVPCQSSRMSRRADSYGRRTLTSDSLEEMDYSGYVAATSGNTLLAAPYDGTSLHPELRPQRTPQTGPASSRLSNISYTAVGAVAANDGRASRPGPAQPPTKGPYMKGIPDYANLNPIHETIISSNTMPTFPGARSTSAMNNETWSSTKNNASRPLPRQATGTASSPMHNQLKTNDARLQQHTAPCRAPTYSITTGNLHPMYTDATLFDMTSQADYHHDHAPSSGTAGISGPIFRPARAPGAAERDRTAPSPVRQPSGAVMYPNGSMITPIKASGRHDRSDQAPETQIPQNAQPGGASHIAYSGTHSSHGGRKPTHYVPSPRPQRSDSIVHPPRKQGTGRGGERISDALSPTQSTNVRTPAHKGFSTWKCVVHDWRTRRDMQKLADQMASQGFHGVDDLKVSRNYKLVRQA